MLQLVAALSHLESIRCQFSNACGNDNRGLWISSSGVGYQDPGKVETSGAMEGMITDTCLPRPATVRCGRACN